MHVLTLGKPGNSGKTVKTRIEAEDPIDAVLLHDRQVHRIAGGEAPIAQDDLFRALENEAVNR